MSNDIDKEGLVISSLLAGAAVYFGLSKKGSSLEDLARVAVGRVIDDQCQQKTRPAELPEHSTKSMNQTFKRVKKKNFRRKK